MRLSVVKVHNQLGNFYLTKIDGKLLEKLSKVDVRQLINEKDSTGLQRNLYRNKVINISEYIDTSYSVFPSSIVVMVNKGVKFNVQDNSIEFDSKEEKLFTIIDGQHRIAAFADSNKSFDVVVSIFDNLSKFQMVELFRVINTTQSALNPNLGDELEVDIPVFTPEKFSVKVIKKLNYDYDSPFFDKIKMYNEIRKDKVNKKSLSLHQFNVELIDKIYRSVKYYHSLKDYLLIDKNFDLSISKIETLMQQNGDKYIFWKYYKTKNIDRLALLLKTYFNVIKRLIPEDWENENGLMFKSVGFRAFMKLFTDVYKKGYEDKSFKTEYLYELMKPINKLDGKLNTRYYRGSSYSVANQVYDDLYRLIF